MVKLGNFQVKTKEQNLPQIDYNTLTDTNSLALKGDKIIIYESFHYPGFSWRKDFIIDRFNLAYQYASEVDFLVFLDQEEIYQPTESDGWQGVPLSSANGPAYMLEGIEIPAMPQAGSAKFFLALLQAWFVMCVRLNKGAAIIGCPVTKMLNPSVIFEASYTKEGLKFIAENYQMIYLYRYPTSLSRANGQEKGYCASELINYFRKDLGYEGQINYILDALFTGTGSADYNVVKADLHNAANALRDDDIISAYPFIKQKDNDTLATKRLIKINEEYKGDKPPMPNETLLFLGDSHTGDFSNGVTELTKDLNNAVGISPTGRVDAIFAMGDMEPVTKWDQAHKASTTKDDPVYFVEGNHDVGNIPQIKALMAAKFPVHPGPAGTAKTSFGLDIGPFHVVVINEYWDEHNNEGWVGGGKDGGEVGDTLRAWLAADLAATTKEIVVLGHEPLYPDQRHVGNSLDWNIASRDALQALFEKYKVKVFVSGHTHFGVVEKHGKVLHIQAGVSGAKAGYNGDAFSSMFFLNVDELGNLIVTWKHDNGNSWAKPTVHTYTITGTPVPPSIIELTLEELKAYNGQNGKPAYAAVGVDIYDLTKSSLWPGGIHEDTHAAGNDLTAQFNGKHSMSKLANIPRAGKLIIPPTPEGENLIKNPGFEKGILDNWTFVTRSDNTPVWDNVSHTGTRSVKISVPGTVSIESGYPESELVPVWPNKNYIARVWGKTQNCGGSNTPAVRVKELDADKKQIGITNIIPVFGRGTNDWQQRKLEFITKENTAFIQIYGDIWQGYGNFWIDDVELRLKDAT